MLVHKVNNACSNNFAYGTNFNGKFVMNEPLYLYNITAPTQSLETFKNTLQKIGKVKDNLRFFIEEHVHNYQEIFDGIWGTASITSYKLFKQEGLDKETKQQLGSTIYFEDNEHIKSNNYVVIQPSRLLDEVSKRLERFYENNTRDTLKNEIKRLTIPEE